MVSESKAPDDLYASTRRLLVKLPARSVLRITLAMTILALLLNYLVGKDLFNCGLYLVSHLQSTPSRFWTTFNNISTTLLDPVLVSGVYALFLLTAKNKQKVISLLVYLLVNTYICTLLKSTFQQHRPYWSVESIDSLGWYCPMDWGNPSGHSWYAVIFYEPLIIQYVGMGYRGTWLSLPIVAILLVPFSRLYLGAHNLNQVVLGLLLGLSSLVAWRYYYERRIKKLVLDFRLSSSDAKVKKSLHILIFIQIITSTVPVLIHLFQPNALFPTEVLKNIEQECAKNPESMKGLNNMMLMASTIINLAFGVLYGIFDSEPLSKFYTGKWKITLKKKRKIAAKTVIDLVMLMLPLSLIYVFSLFPFKHMLMQYTVVSVALTLSGYLYMRLSPVLEVKYNIIQLLEAE